MDYKKELFSLADRQYAAFQAKLTPGIKVFARHKEQRILCPHDGCLVHCYRSAQAVERHH